MNEELTQREKFWLRLALVAVFTVTAGLIIETFRLLLPGLPGKMVQSAQGQRAHRGSAAPDRQPFDGMDPVGI